MKAALDLHNRVCLTWENPAGAARAVLVRKTRDYPRTLRDGLTVLDILDPGVTVHTDPHPWPGRFNYYRAFWQAGDGNWLQSAGDRARIRVEPLYGYQDKLYANLPEIYRRHDEAGELKRFLGVAASAFERLRVRQSELFDLHNVNQVRDDMLEPLAWNVGWLLNRELPIIRQRAEINRAVDIYRKKGTAKGLRDLLQAIMPWDVEIITFKRNILFTNAVPGYTLRVSDPAVTMNMMTARDQAHYIIGGPVNPNRILIKVWSDYELDLFDRVWRKLERFLHLWIPACMEAVVQVGTRNRESGRMADSRPEEPDNLDWNWLFTNKFIEDEPNPNGFETFRQKVTTSLLWRTPCLSVM